MVRSQSYIATPPGATIREQLKYKGLSQKDFAVRMDLSEEYVSKLINGKVQLTPEIAEMQSPVKQRASPGLTAWNAALRFLVRSTC